MGCKAFFSFDGFDYKKSFTLTMWDVKRINDEASEKLAKFYLNYVGCEGEKFSCFTLTMWDVKSLRVTTWQLVHESFTLTMWDVKSAVINEGLAGGIVLP